MVGALVVEALNVQRERAMTPGQTVEIGRYAFRFEGVDQQTGPNYQSERGHVQVLRNDQPWVLRHPEKRAYASGGQVMTEAAVDWGVLRDRYVALGESLGNGSWAVRVHSKPMMGFIWLAVVLIALGGFITAADRRFRRYQEEKPA